MKDEQIKTLNRAKRMIQETRDRLEYKPEDMARGLNNIDVSARLCTALNSLQEAIDILEEE